MKPVLWVMLATTLGATLWVTTQASNEVEPMVRAGNRSASSAPAPASAQRGARSDLKTSPDVARLEKLSQALNDWLAYRQARQAQPAGAAHAVVVASGDMASWASQRPPPPPPQPPYIPPPPPPPMAPPFAHAWVGRYVDTEPRAVIAGPSQTWVVKVGDVVDSQWHVDHIAERQMTLTYLPLKQTQTVSMK